MNLPPRPPQPTIQITSSVASVPSTTYASPRSGGSLHGSARSKISVAHSQRSRRVPSKSEFDPAILREEWLRRMYINQIEPRVPTEYSYVLGRPRHKDHRQPKASISIDIPSPLADRLFAHRSVNREEIWADILAAHSQWYNFNRPPVVPLPPAVSHAPVSIFDSFEGSCVFAVLTLSTMAVFVVLTFIYLKGFVKV